MRLIPFNSRSREESPRAPWLICLAFLSSCTPACGPDYILHLSSPHETLPHPRFRIESGNSDDSASKYHAVSVCEEEERLPWNCHWSVGPSYPRGSDPLPRELVFGETPPGFQNNYLRDPGRPLLPGHSYSFSVSGPYHATGSMDFHVTEDGRVLEGTAPIQGDAGR